jgi:predicted nucleic acid-binding protein
MRAEAPRDASQPAPTLLVDTSILAELTRARPDAGVLEWARGARGFAISAVTVEELYHALGRRPDAGLRTWVDAFATPERVLPVSLEVARQAGLLRAQLGARGIRRTQADLLVAATAAVHALTLVTRRPRDFDGCGVPLLDPSGGDEEETVWDD